MNVLKIIDGKLIGNYNSIFRKNILKSKRHCLCLFSTKKENIDDEDDESPVKYSTSNASKWKAHHTHFNKPSTSPPSEGYAILLSVSAFMLYFFWLREENDLDEVLKISIFERSPEIEISTLKGTIMEYKKNNIDTTVLEKRLKALESQLS